MPKREYTAKEDKELAQTHRLSDYKLSDVEGTFKAKVVSLSPIQYIETKFGNRPYTRITMEYQGTPVTVNLFLPTKPILTPRSTAYKLLKKYGCKNLEDLIGKELELTTDNRGFIRLVI